jgi:hypothetical protein
MEPARRYADLAQCAVLDHLMTSHADAIEHKTITAVGMLVLAGAAHSSC